MKRKDGERMITETPTKRKRGRPPKNQSVEPKVEKKVEEEQPKKKRGRPPKKQVVEQVQPKEMDISPKPKSTKKPTTRKKKDKSIDNNLNTDTPLIILNEIDELEKDQIDVINRYYKTDKWEIFRIEEKSNTMLITMSPIITKIRNNPVLFVSMDFPVIMKIIMEEKRETKLRHNVGLMIKDINKWIIV